MVSGRHDREKSDYELSLAALLHDIVEHGGVSFRELKKMGFPDRTVELVELCTHSMEIKDHTERWIKMMLRLVEAGDEDGWLIKLAELADNLTQSKNSLLKNWRFIVEIKAPILLQLGRINHSVYFMLKEELRKQQKEIENMRRYAVTKWIEGFDCDGLANDFKILGEFDNRGDAFVFAVTETEVYIRNRMSIYKDWEDIERDERNGPSYSRPNQFNKVVFSKNASRRDKTGYNSISIFIDVIEIPYGEIVSEKMFDVKDCNYEVHSFFSSNKSEEKEDVFHLIKESQIQKSKIVLFME
jgi:hypothetical protein